MPTNILTDAKLYVAQFNISGDQNSIKLVSAADLKEDTAFGAAYKTMKGGGALIRTKLNGSGFVQSGTTGVEDIIQGRLGTDSVPITVAGEGGDAGESCRFFKGVFAAYDAGAKVGDLHQLNYNAENSGLGTNNPLIRGTIFEDGKTSRVAAGNSAVFTLGAVAAGQSVFAQLHLLAFVGTNVTFKLRSAVTSFATITDRITFTQATGLTSEYGTPAAGAITDTFWRMDWTGTFTSFSAVLVAGIQ